MGVFFVTTTTERTDGRGAWRFPFECKFETMEQLHGALARTPVRGYQLIYRPGSKGDGVKLITRRMDYILSKDGVRSIAPVNVAFRDETPADLAAAPR